MPSGTRANIVGQKPRPRPSAKASGKQSASSASDGSARPTLATLMATTPPRPKWPRAMPTGSATTSASARATPESTRCSPTRAGMLSTPCQRSGCAIQVTTAPRNSMPSAPGPSPGRRPALHADEPQVERNGHGDGQNRADDDLRPEQIVLDAIQYEET